MDLQREIATPHIITNPGFRRALGTPNITTKHTVFLLVTPNIITNPIFKRHLATPNITTKHTFVLL